VLQLFDPFFEKLVLVLQVAFSVGDHVVDQVEDDTLLLFNGVVDGLDLFVLGLGLKTLTISFSLPVNPT